MWQNSGISLDCVVGYAISKPGFLWAPAVQNMGHCKDKMQTCGDLTNSIKSAQEMQNGTPIEPPVLTSPCPQLQWPLYTDACDKEIQSAFFRMNLTVQTEQRD